MQSYAHTHTQKEQIVFLSSIYKLAGVFLWFPILHCTTKPIWFSPKRWGPAGGQWDCLKWPKIIPQKIKGSRINPPRSSLSPTETRFPRFVFRGHVWQPRFFFCANKLLEETQESSHTQGFFWSFLRPPILWQFREAFPTWKFGASYATEKSSKIL